MKKFSSVLVVLVVLVALVITNFSMTINNLKSLSSLESRIALPRVGDQGNQTLQIEDLVVTQKATFLNGIEPETAAGFVSPIDPLILGPEGEKECFPLIFRMTSEANLGTGVDIMYCDETQSLRIDGGSASADGINPYPSIVLGLGRGMGGGLILHDQEGVARLEVCIGGDGEPRILLRNREGEITWRAPNK